MAGKRRRANGTWEYVFKRAGVLEKPLYLTFDSEEEGDAVATNLDKLLARGIVPTQFLPSAGVRLLCDLVAAYERDAHPSAKDRGAFGPILRERGKTPLAAISAAWSDAWIDAMKREERLAPATIRARVGALARAIDWGRRKELMALPENPLRTLPEGYAQYTALDASLAGGGRRDVERDRRLEPGEHERILAVLAGGELARKYKPLQLPEPDAMRVLYVLAVESAMRLREMYTLEPRQVDLARRTVFLEKTKNGDKRQVPLSSVALAALRERLEAGAGAPRVFPWWDGDASPRSLVRTSDYLSKLYAGVFEQAGAQGLRFHDLRHEAVCRLFERTTLSAATPSLAGPTPRSFRGSPRRSSAASRARSTRPASTSSRRPPMQSCPMCSALPSRTTRGAAMEP